MKRFRLGLLHMLLHLVEFFGREEVLVARHAHFKVVYFTHVGVVSQPEHLLEVVGEAVFYLRVEIIFFFDNIFAAFTHI